MYTCNSVKVHSSGTQGFPICLTTLAFDTSDEEKIVECVEHQYEGLGALVASHFLRNRTDTASILQPLGLDMWILLDS